MNNKNNSQLLPIEICRRSTRLYDNVTEYQLCKGSTQLATVRQPRDGILSPMVGLKKLFWLTIY